MQDETEVDRNTQTLCPLIHSPNAVAGTEWGHRIKARNTSGCTPWMAGTQVLEKSAESPQCLHVIGNGEGTWSQPLWQLEVWTFQMAPNTVHHTNTYFLSHPLKKNFVRLRTFSLLALWSQHLNLSISWVNTCWMIACMSRKVLLWYSPSDGDHHGHS